MALIAVDRQVYVRVIREHEIGHNEEYGANESIVESKDVDFNLIAKAVYTAHPQRMGPVTRTYYVEESLI